MARYVASIEQSYKQPIPYHFTCNYCGEVSQKSYEITIGVQASARHVGDARREAGRQHDKQVRQSVREKRKAIEDYRRHLVAGTAVTDKKLCRIPLRSECEHCGRQQMWNPPARPATADEKKISPMILIGLIGTGVGFIGLFFTAILLWESGIPLAVKLAFAALLAVGIVCLAINSRRENRLEAAWFKANLASEPNDPDKLPVIDQ